MTRRHGGAKLLTTEPLDLPAAARRLGLRSPAVNPKAVRAYMVGINYVKLEAAQ